ncbi:MAG: alanine--tRNA ligase, partial [Solirubrobacteraceae bacterium]
TTEQIRQTFLGFFVERDHRRLPSGSLVPATFDASVLLTTAGMHPLKPYFLGRERPPHQRLTTCQKCFRTPDIDEVGTTARHLTFFEMLGNFSIGDYFKQSAVELAWELSLDGYGLDPDNLWITVFEGDEELGLGPDEEAIEAWRSVGVPRERIVPCPRSENFWQAGPTGPCGPCSELYFDRGPQFGSPDDLPGGDNERFLEYWNLVFMQFDQDPVGVLTPLPAKNIDTGLGLNRLAAVLQGVPSVFETDQFRPLVELGEELSGRRYGESFRVDRALRILADHSRGMTFLVADGVVPSNEDRGYVLRRVMRRAIQQGRSLGLAPGFLPVFAERVTELMGSEYPELHRECEAIRTWTESEEAGFGRTLDQGLGLLEDLITRARERGDEGIAAQDAFLLHDTFGFPFDLTLELLAEHGLGVDGRGFEALMDAQRERARQGTARNLDDGRVRERVRVFASGAGFETDFVGYERTEQATTVGAVMVEDGRVVAKLAESPFYAAGGGQVSDDGEVVCADGECRARVEEVFRLGDDQAVALAVQEGSLEPGSRVVARVDRAARHATECNHTATHLLHAALRERLGGHVRQAGSHVGPDKLRFDFTHGSALTAEERRDVEDRVNEWILSNRRVRALETTLEEARSLGAMALFGEKYGDVVRMVEVGDGDFSRELCGGTHVRSTAEIGLFRLLSEGSSAANVRRIEAITGPEGIELVRRHDELLGEAAARLRVRPEHVLDAVQGLQGRLREAERAARASNGGPGAVDVEELLGRAVEVDGAKVLAEAVTAVDEKALLALADKLKGRLGDAAVVLGARDDERALLVATVAPELVGRGVKAGQVIKEAARVVGGGGGGRDTMARAGGRDPSRLEDAMAVAREAIERALR